MNHPKFITQKKKQREIAALKDSRIGFGSKASKRHHPNVWLELWREVPKKTYHPKHPNLRRYENFAKRVKVCNEYLIMLVVSTHLKNISQIGSCPQVGGQNKKCLKPPSRYLIKWWKGLLPRHQSFLWGHFKFSNHGYYSPSCRDLFGEEHESRKPWRISKIKTCRKSSRQWHRQKSGKRCWHKICLA